MNPKPNQFFSAIRTDPGNYGITGRVVYTAKGSWHFYPDPDPDEPTSPSALMQNLARGEFTIPSKDRVGMPAKLNDLLNRRARAFGSKHGSIKHVADGMTQMICKGTFMDKLSEVMDKVNRTPLPRVVEVSYNDQHGEVKHRTLRDLYGSKTHLT